MNRQGNLKYGWLALAMAMASMLPVAQAQWGGWGNSPDAPVTAEFDRDKNGWLDKAERKAAYQSLTGAALATKTSVDPIHNGKVSAAQVKTFPGKGLYDADVVRTLFLSFEDSNWEAQLVAFKGTDVELPATAMVDGKSYPQVGVHFRGQTSFMSASDGTKRSLKVSFDLVDKQQNLLGYDSLELLNAAGDASFVRNVLYMQIARDYLPAPKVNYMRVVINGEDWGIYVNAQPFNGQFVKQAVGASGPRWKVPGSPRSRGGLEYFGEAVDSYRSVFEIKSKDKPESWAALINLTRVLNQTPPDKLEAALKPILDIDEVLRFLAVDNALINNDGYWVRASDYHIYQDKHGVFHVTPHDANETLRDLERMSRRWNSGNGANNNPLGLDPLVSEKDPTKPLLSKLLAVPALKQRYLNYVRDIATKWLDWNRLGPIASQHHALIADYVHQDQRKLYSNAAFDGSLTQDGNGEGFGMVSSPDISIKSFAERRRAFLLDYFARNPKPAGT